MRKPRKRSMTLKIARVVRHSAIVLLLFFMTNATDIDSETCPKGCRCEEPTTLLCADLDLLRIPADWSTRFQKIFLRNCSMNTLHKNAFRRFQKLEELRVTHCPNLDLIDKFSFKGLQKLRNVHNLRELTIEDRCIKIASHAFSTISKVDFLTLKGVCSFEERSFSNTSRIHQLHIFDSSANLTRNMFVKLSHVNQILIHESGIEKVEEGAFSEMFTIGSLQIQSNRIGRVAPRALVGAENLGTLIFSYNTVIDPLESPECLLNEAHKMVFTENTVHCSCPMRWIEHYQDRTVLNENYCGKEEAFKTLAFYQPRGCPVPETTPDPSLITEIITFPTSTVIENRYTSSVYFALPSFLLSISSCLISVHFTFCHVLSTRMPYILLI